VLTTYVQSPSAPPPPPQQQQQSPEKPGPMAEQPAARDVQKAVQQLQYVPFYRVCCCIFNPGLLADATRFVLPHMLHATNMERLLLHKSSYK